MMPPDTSALEQWDFSLPDGLIARYPPQRRTQSRLMVVESGRPPEDHTFAELPALLRRGDLLVANDTRVMAARLHARRVSGGQVEILCLDPGPGLVRALVRPLRRLKDGEALHLDCGDRVTLVDRAEDGLCRIRFDGDPAEVMARAGSAPLPPYLGRDAEPVDAERYQTVYAGPLGASAAPTAGLHFDQPLLDQLAAVGVGWATVTLHVGLGTFRPLRAEDIERGTLHREPYTVPVETAERIRETRASGGRIIGVGTTTVRTLEAATPEDAEAPTPGDGSTDLFIQPGYRFRATDGMITNFHLPRSSLLMLVAARISRDRLFSSYQAAIERQYRFYSYGDAMLLL